jgi:hypothetical protein
MFFALPVATDNILKLLVLLAVGGGLLLLGRWSSRLSVPRDGAPPADTPTPDAAELQEERKSTPKIWPPTAEELAAQLTRDPELGRIQIKKFFFKKVDAIPGPDDPDVFADELLIELHDPDSDHYWWQSYFVATPLGLQQILREKSWRYLHAPQILVLPKYDLEEIRRAAVSRIMADHDYFKDKEQPEEESL